MTLTYEQQQQLETLTPLIGSEAAVRVQLTSVEAELADLRTAAEPLEVRQQELTETLSRIAEAKAEAVRIKTSRAPSATK